MSNVRLVCFPWAGAGASAYAKFAAFLPEATELIAVQLPGREDRSREPAAAPIAAVAEEVADQLRRGDERPIALFGHSMGALAAYETALALRRKAGVEPRLVMVSGAGAPGTSNGYDRCPAASSDETFAEEMRRLGGTPPEVLDDPQMMRSLLPVIRADYQVLEAYAPVPTPPLSCPIVACASHSDPSVSRETVRAWAPLTKGAFRERWVEGNHFYLCLQSAETAQWLQAMISEYCHGRPAAGSPVPEGSLE
jgi:surfactin synthase thioesterase subunit